jgi:hypothetical protein
MIPDGISSCRVAVPSPRDLLAPWPRSQAGPAAGAAAGAESSHENPKAHGSPKAYGVLQSHPVVNRVCPRLLAPCVPPTDRVLGCTLMCGLHWFRGLGALAAPVSLFHQAHASLTQSACLLSVPLNMCASVSMARVRRRFGGARERQLRYLSMGYLLYPVPLRPRPWPRSLCRRPPLAALRLPARASRAAMRLRPWPDASGGWGGGGGVAWVPTTSLRPLPLSLGAIGSWRGHTMHGQHTMHDHALRMACDPQTMCARGRSGRCTGPREAGDRDWVLCGA